MTPPGHGTLSGAAPDLLYTPAADYNGSDSFTFTVTDASSAASAPATVSITVTPVNDTPTANPQSVTTTEDVAASITLTGTDPESEALTFAIATPPQHGTLSGAAPNLTYTPAVAFTGSDSLTFTASDPEGGTSGFATISITVTPGGGSNQPPVCSAAVAGPSNLWPPNHQMVQVSILGVSDPEGGTLAIAATSIRQDEPLNGTGDGDTSPDATLSPPAVRSERRQNGNGRVYTIDFKAIDPQGASCVGVVKVCVPKSQGGSHSTCIDDGPTVDSTGGVQ